MIRNIALAFIIVGLIVRAFLMKDVLFYDWDEGIYAEVASGLNQHQDIQTRFNEQVWFNKPPLSHYLIASAFRVIPDKELAGRLTMVVIASSMLVLLYVLSRRLMSYFFTAAIKKLPPIEREIGFLLPVFLTASTPVVIERATQLNSDVMLAVFWIAYFLSENSFIGKLFALTAGTLTKSLLGLYPFAFEVLISWKSLLKPKKILQLILLLCIPLTWHVVNYMIYGQRFITSHLMDQLVKRVTNPIELHFGGRLYYVLLAWENLHLLFILVICSYLLIAFDALNIVKNRFDLKKYWREVIDILHSKEWPKYLTLCAGAPFFIFLSFVQSKISWYFATVLPLMTLVISYMYFRFSFKYVRYLLAAAIIAFWLYRFIPMTYAFQITSFNNPDFIKVAQCVSKLQSPTVSVLVNAQERQNRNVLEAAQQQTDTSFIYGGSPSFVYYTGKTVQYYYKPEEFVADNEKHRLVVVSEQDIQNSLYQIGMLLKLYEPITSCTYGEWRVFSFNR